MKRTGLIVGFDHLDAKRATEICEAIERRFPDIAVAVINASCQPIAFEYDAVEGEK